MVFALEFWLFFSSYTLTYVPSVFEYPPEIDFTTQSDTGSIEYAYMGTFTNAFDVMGRGVEGQSGWLKQKSGLYLTGNRGFNFITLEIDGDQTYPVYVYQREILNTGTIGGPDYSIYSASQIATLIRNSGNLDGDVHLGDGADQLVNTGWIYGSVFAGDEQATYYERPGDVIENHGVITGPVDLGAGHDVFTSFGDAIVGNRSKAAVVYGRDGNDILTGAESQDVFRGGQGHDRLVGRQGQDRLLGNAGNDWLRGGAGNDILDGGLGQDRLTGDGGDDVFRFRLIGTSRADQPPDRILDFKPGADRINLSRVVDDIQFIGTEDFSAGGDAELRYAVETSGAASVMLDADGDGAADMLIRVLNTPLLQESDFIL